MSHKFDFLFKIKIRPLQLDCHHFQSTEPKLVLCGQFLSDFGFVPHFYENCLTNLNLFSKSKSDYCTSNGDIFSELDCVYTVTLSFGMDEDNGQQMAALGLI